MRTTTKNDHMMVQRLLDGSLSNEGFQAIQLRLRREPELVQLYRQYALLHHVLCEEFEGQRLIAKPRLTAARRFSLVVAGLAAAAVIVLVASVVMRSPATPRPQAPQSAALASFSADAVWEIGGESQPTGADFQLRPGATIRLHQGQARVTLSSSAVAVIDGDSELEFVSDEMLRLGHGRGRFRMNQAGAKLAVATASFTAVDLGTEFGLLSRQGQPDELHVFEGRVELRLPTADERPVLVAGDAARVTPGRAIERMPVAMPRFPQAAPQFVELLDDRFDQNAPPSSALDQHQPLQGSGSWRVVQGKPALAGQRLEGADFEAFFKVPGNALNAAAPILLATLETVEPLHGKFHTDGWSGMSFYREGREVLFFGDSFGPEATWSIDVKQGLPIVLPKSPVSGAQRVTLCYNRNTGAASLHLGSLPLVPAFCAAQLPPGMEFDEIRIGASPGASLALRSLTVRTGESSEGKR